MFIRLFNPSERKEILFNINLISKIEVMYGILSDGKVWSTTLESAHNNPDAIRFYTLYIAGEEIKLPANPNDPVMKVIEDIYHSAIKS